MAKGETEVTGHYSVVSFAAGGGDRERIQDSFGLNAAVGIDGDAEFRLRYERIELAESADGINVLGAGPKFVVSPEHVAFFLPFGFAFGEDIQTSDTWETHPTFLFSGSPVPWVEITGSAKALLRLREPVSGPRLAFNVGLAIGPDPSAFAIRPEVGFMVNTGGEGHYRHLGVGVSVGFGEPRSARGMEGAFAYEGIDFRGRGGMVEVTGRIVNRSGRDYAAVTFLVTAQDTLGRVLASDYLYLSDFKSGETRRFNTFIVQVDYAGVAECGLRFDSAY